MEGGATPEKPQAKDTPDGLVKIASAIEYFTHQQTAINEENRKREKRKSWREILTIVGLLPLRLSPEVLRTCSTPTRCKLWIVRTIRPGFHGRL